MQNSQRSAARFIVAGAIIFGFGTWLVWGISHCQSLQIANADRAKTLLAVLLHMLLPITCAVLGVAVCLVSDSWNATAAFMTKHRKSKTGTAVMAASFITLIVLLSGIAAAVFTVVFVIFFNLIMGLLGFLAFRHVWRGICDAVTDEVDLFCGPWDRRKRVLDKMPDGKRLKELVDRYNETDNH